MRKLTKKERFNDKVLSKFQVYNSIFSTLPYESISNTGVMLPLFEKICVEGYNNNNNPTQIVDNFFTIYLNKSSEKEKIALLFQFIQYIERQVVLFDAVEDASFSKINNLDGRGTLRSLKEEVESKNKKKEFKKYLSKFKVRPVLTAHPTQFYPGSVLGIITDLTDAVKNNDLVEIKTLLSQLGKTPFFKNKKPSPYDEAVSLTWYLENVFYNSISNIYKYIRSNIFDGKEFNNDILNLGYWPGGDRDGKPFVTTEITLKTSLKLRSDIIKNYYRDVRKLRRRLTFKGIEEVVIDIEDRLYMSMFENVEKTSISLDEFKQKLLYIKDKIINEYESLFIDQVQDLIDKVNIFGYHFASLDIRQDSSIHNDVFKRIIDFKHGKDFTKKYYEMSEDDKIEFISNSNFESQNDKFSDVNVLNTLGSIDAMRAIQKSNGEKGCHRYIISHNESALNIFEVFYMFKISGWVNPLVDIVPLFETIEDLNISVSVMEKVYRNKLYKNHLKSRGSEQIIMLGFSDGTKDGGYFTANWEILKAKENLTKLSLKYGIKVKFFDGRGGPPARGGGNTHQFYSSLSGVLDSKQIQLTIQGQTISSNFGTIDSCQYNLEQLISSSLNNSEIKSSDSVLSDDNRKTMDKLSEISFKAYNDFKSHPMFLSYLEQMSTIKYYAKTNIGSRPSKRPSKTEAFDINSLRAIPFVGGWSQLKQNVPGFYGLGSAINYFIKNNDFKKIQALYNDVPFFRTLLSNSMMSLKKSFFDLTLYLAEDKEFSGIWNIIYNEYKLTKKMSLKVSKFNTLMENEPANKASIEAREKIILPLFTIQQYAIQNLNKLKSTNKGSINEINVFEKIITRSLFGNINASRNSA